MPQNYAWNDSRSDFYSLIFQNCPIAIFALDREGDIQLTNRQVQQSTGYGQSELSGAFNRLMTEACVDRVQNYFRLALSGEPQSFRCEVKHKSGQVLDVEASFLPLVADGTIVGVYGYASNVTEMYKKDAELARMTKSLNLAQEIVKIGSWDYDVASHHVYCSEALYAILGFTSLEGAVPRYEDLLAMIVPEDRQVFDRHFQHIVRSGKPMDLEYRILRQDQSILSVHVRAVAKRDDRGQVDRVIGVLSDISEKVLTENRLKESEEKFETVARNLDVGIWSIDTVTGKMLYTSPAAKMLTGYSEDDFLTGRIAWLSLIHPDDVQSYHKLQEPLGRGEMVTHQYRILHKDAGIRWMEMKMFPILDADGRLVQLDGIVQDISERKRSEEEIHYYAYHDYLTGLPNRRKFDEQLGKLIDEHDGTQGRFALYYLDMDRFKIINDTLGHEIGDALLCDVAERLTPLSESHAVFRIGGDEFAIVLPDLDTQDPAVFGRKLMGQFERAFLIQGYEFHMTTSVGISIYPDDGATLDQLRMSADVALYRAKDLGKNTVQLFTHALNMEFYERFTLENDLRKAIQREEFILHYQPRVDTVTGEIVGAEALIRWTHPERGLIPPAEFITLAEETGFIHAISDWVIERVCRQLNDWKAEGCEIVPISINLSPKSLIHAALVEKIKANLTKHRIAPGLIEIEITEDSYIKNEGAALPTIQSIREMGIPIAIDDFGKGYSSIGYLKKFNIDTIKIDRSFIQGIERNTEDFTIVQSIIMLASGFRLKIVAEGVETEEQLARLQSLNCHYIQGYLFSRPLPADQVAVMLREEKKVLLAQQTH